MCSKNARADIKDLNHVIHDGIHILGILMYKNDK